MRNLDNLTTRGIAIVDGVNSKSELIRLAKSIGIIKLHPNGEELAVLKSTDGVNSISGTFSNIHGLAAFPFHTDTAFWGVPARYVVMGMLNKSSCTTNFISLNDLKEFITEDFLSKARKSIYLLETIEGSKYTSLIFSNNNDYGIRFDPNIMTPANEHAKRFHEELVGTIGSVESIKINWNGNKAIVFDNWKYLHSRSAVKNEKREVFRIYLEKVG